MLPEKKRLSELDETIIQIVSTASHMAKLLRAIELSEHMPPQLKEAAHTTGLGLDPLFGACADHLKKVNQQNSN